MNRDEASAKRSAGAAGTGAFEAEHRWAQQALPWQVNETLPQAEARRLDAHLQACGRCRADLRLERRIAGHLAQDVVVPHTPQAGFARLAQRIDAEAEHRRPGGRRRRWRPWFGVALAAQAAAILVLSLTTAWYVLRPSPPQAPYRTLASAPAERGDHLQVVFADTVTAGEIQRLLASVGAHIVGGPSPAGVVLVAVAPGEDGAANLEAAARRLSAEQGVRFVSVQRAPSGPGP